MTYSVYGMTSELVTDLSQRHTPRASLWRPAECGDIGSNSVRGADAERRGGGLYFLRTGVIVSDNGPNSADVLDAWADRYQTELRFIRPGKPIENATHQGG